MAGEGTDGIAAMIGAAQAQFPGHRFELSFGPGRAQRRRALRVAAVGAATGRSRGGTDFATVADDGRLRNVTGFLETAEAWTAPPPPPAAPSSSRSPPASSPE